MSKPGDIIQFLGNVVPCRPSSGSESSAGTPTDSSLRAHPAGHPGAAARAMRGMHMHDDDAQVPAQYPVWIGAVAHASAGPGPAVVPMHFELARGCRSGRL